MPIQPAGGAPWGYENAAWESPGGVSMRKLHIVGKRGVLREWMPHMLKVKF